MDPQTVTSNSNSNQNTDQPLDLPTSRRSSRRRKLSYSSTTSASASAPSRALLSCYKDSTLQELVQKPKNIIKGRSKTKIGKVKYTADLKKDLSTRANLLLDIIEKAANLFLQPVHSLSLQ
ncbi:hypothetical protein AVEN_83388-1 [Araneus ventricosus]|uniref:Uncharacterized protein n=1 Tax=Araneus ventricosus TaxID=182803 RepID=A0A4Y2HJV4_ARAVE|nr:hypothetical protein AVEN_83388-1 [Araneus ventricosus]